MDSPQLGNSNGMSSTVQPPTAAQIVKYEDCLCENHCVLHPISGVYPPCAYNDQVGLAYDSKGNTDYGVMKQPEPDREVVMEDGGFLIEKVPEGISNWDKHDSYIMHFCPSLYWKVYLDEGIMLAEGVCIHCMEVVPPGLIALWKMHNWSYIQNGISATVEACSSA